MALRITVDIFSGRPNPVIEVDDGGAPRSSIARPIFRLTMRRPKRECYGNSPVSVDTCSSGAAQQAPRSSVDGLPTGHS
jgi:hypothetical protein